MTVWLHAATSSNLCVYVLGLKVAVRNTRIARRLPRLARGYFAAPVPSFTPKEMAA